MFTPYKTIYFGDKPLRFVASTEIATDCCADASTYLCRGSSSGLSTANIIKIFGTYDALLCIADNVAEEYERWTTQFKFVRAAGGIVVAPHGEVVMIRRSGHWDLPKGHIEAGESAEVCAVREIEEETGVAGAKIERYLCNTLHAYNVYGAWELKQTSWFWLTADTKVPLTPQRSEGIMEAKWCDAPQREVAMQTAYATIREVFAEYEQIKKK